MSEENNDINEAKQLFFEDIERDLGGSLIDVELDYDDYERCFKKAKKMFQQRGNDNYQHRFIALKLERDKREYEIPEEYNLDHVVRLIRPRGGQYYTDDPFHLSAMYDFISVTRGNHQFDLLSYDLSRQILDQIDQRAARDIPFHFNKFNNKLTLYGDPIGEETWFVECYIHSEDEEYIQMDWIQRWTKAEAKEMLGYAYRKFSEVRTPTGTSQLPGSDLIQEAKSEKEELLEEIRNYTDGLPTGHFIHIG